jgi:hypothetical protein
MPPLRVLTFLHFTASFVGPELFSGFLNLQGVTPTRPDGSLAMYISQVHPNLFSFCVSFCFFSMQKTSEKGN